MLNISFLICTKVELMDLIVCIAVNGEKFQSCTVTLTLVPQCPIWNLSKIFSYTCITMCSNFMFIDQLLFELSCKHQNHTHARTHTHTHTINIIHWIVYLHQRKRVIQLQTQIGSVRSTLYFRLTHLFIWNQIRRSTLTFPNIPSRSRSFGEAILASI